MVSVLLVGCTRAGFDANGDGSADSAPDASRLEAAVPDMKQGCGPGLPTHRWSRGAGTTGKDYGVAVAVDASGNVYLTGMFTGTLNFGGQDISSNGGSADLFVASYTAAGAHRWSAGFGGAGDDSGDHLQLDASGNLYVTGRFAGTTSFGGAPLTSQGIDAFVASFTSTGAHRWSNRFGGTSSDGGYGVATDGSGNVYLTGHFKESADFGGGPLTSKGKADTFLTSFSSSGAHRWTRRFGGVGEDYGAAITVDPSGNVTTAGRFFGSANFEGTTLSSTGQDDMFIVSHTSAGSSRWSRRVGGAGEDAPFDLAVDGRGNVFVTGRFQQSVDFGGGPVNSKGGSDIFVASYTDKGDHRWSRGIGGAGDDAGRRLAVDGRGNLLLAAVFHGTADPGGGPLTSSGGGDVLAASYTNAGAPCWQLSFGDAGDEAGYGVAAHGSGQVVLAGWFYDTLNLGGQPLTSAGGMDIFVAAFSH